MLISLDIAEAVLYNKAMTNKQQLASELKMVGWLGGLVTDKQGELNNANLVTIQEAMTKAQRALDALKVGTQQERQKINAMY